MPRRQRDARVTAPITGNGRSGARLKAKQNHDLVKMIQDGYVNAERARAELERRGTKDSRMWLRLLGGNTNQ